MFGTNPKEGNEETKFGIRYRGEEVVLSRFASIEQNTLVSGEGAEIKRSGT